MESSYDEDLIENPFFQVLRQEYATTFEKAVSEGWIICIPRCGSFAKSALVEDDFLAHILVPEEENSGTHFRTLAGKEVKVCNRVLSVEYDIAKPCCAHLLFEETFYSEEQSKYSLWCIECPLEQSISASRDDVLIVTNLRECLDLLWTEVSNKDIIKDIVNAVAEFKQTCDRLEDEPLHCQRDLVGDLYAKTLRILLQDVRLRDKTASDRYFLQTIKIAVETYVLNGLRDLLPHAISARTAFEDAMLNKTIKNLHDVQLRDLCVRSDIYNGILRGKMELSRLDDYATVLGKIGCLKRTVRYISEGVTLVSSDDLLPVLIFLVLRAGLPNWIAQIMFMKQFRFAANSSNDADEAGFLITSLEAAIEHVKSGVLTVSRNTAANESGTMNAFNADAKENDASLSNLFTAVRKCDLPEIERILAKDSEKLSNSLVKLCHPLCSCESCERNLAKSSLSGWPTVRSRDDRGMTAIHVASLCGHATVVDFLLEHGANPNDADADGSTPLHCAASRGHQNTLLMLLHANADPTIADTRGNTPLHLAADYGHEACVKALLYFTEQMRIIMDKSPANSNGETPLHHAAKWGYGNIVAILMEHGANPRATNRRGQTPLVVAHSSHITKFLIEGIPNGDISKVIRNHATTPSDTSNTVSPGCANGKVKTSPRTNSTNETRKTDRLLAAIAEGDLRLAYYYLGLEGPHKISADKVNNFCHPLCVCERCTVNDDSMDEEDHTPSLGLNVANGGGETPLHVACAYGRTELVQMLLDAGASVNVTTAEGRTPLHLACSNGWAKIVKLLLNCGTCDINAKDLTGDTPLHVATRNGNSRIVQLLIRYGANTNIRNTQGTSPLHEVEKITTSDIFLSQSFSNIAKILKTNGVHNSNFDDVA